MRLVRGRSTPEIRAIVLSLPLLVLLVRADHPDHPTAADDLALVADLFDRRSDFHGRLEPSPRWRARGCATQRNLSTTRPRLGSFGIRPPARDPRRSRDRSCGPTGLGQVRRHLVAVRSSSTSHQLARQQLAHDALRPRVLAAAQAPSPARVRSRRSLYQLQPDTANEPSISLTAASGSVSTAAPVFGHHHRVLEVRRQVLRLS